MKQCQSTKMNTELDMDLFIMDLEVDMICKDNLAVLVGEDASWMVLSWKVKWFITGLI